MLGNARFFPAGRGMFSSARSSSRRLTAFVRCVREDGADALASYLAANEAQGLLYHRDAVHFTGDYDISEDEAEIFTPAAGGIQTMIPGAWRA